MPSPAPWPVRDWACVPSVISHAPARTRRDTPFPIERDAVIIPPAVGDPGAVRTIDDGPASASLIGVAVTRRSHDAYSGAVPAVAPGGVRPAQACIGQTDDLAPTPNGMPVGHVLTGAVSRPTPVGTAEANRLAAMKPIRMASSSNNGLRKES